MEPKDPSTSKSSPLPDTERLMKLVGKKLHIYGKNNVRYEGHLYAVEPNANIPVLVLIGARFHGTEGRTAFREVPPVKVVHKYLAISADDIKIIDVFAPDPPKVIFKGCRKWLPGVVLFEFDTEKLASASDVASAQVDYQMFEFELTAGTPQDETAAAEQCESSSSHSSPASNSSENTTASAASFDEAAKKSEEVERKVDELCGLLAMLNLNNTSDGGPEQEEVAVLFVKDASAPVDVVTVGEDKTDVGGYSKYRNKRRRLN